MQFFLRNRIITGMSKAIVIIEARGVQGSGTMHQIEFALKRNKPAFIWKPKKGREFEHGFRLYAKEGAKPFEDVSQLKSMLNEIMG